MSTPSFSPPRGTQDVLPDAWVQRHRVLDVARARFERAGYGRISTPTFEHTELFQRGVGETTDIVSKEMYTFTDRSDRSLTLRPEGTAGVARAYVNHGMHRQPLPVKLWYFAPMFRYEKPQAGRLREHYQLGCEVMGSELPAVDAELIALLHGIYDELGVAGLTLRLNSIGSTASRAVYLDALVGYLRQYEADLDADSRTRLERNPLRILDSKDPRTREIIAGAPTITDHLDAPDRAHFDAVQELLAAVGVAATLDPLLVRGLDYYTRTVFEFSSPALGAQDTVGAGGRYDGLVEQVGGPPTPAVGFGCGVERLVLALGGGDEDQTAAAATPVDAYIGVADADGWPAALAVAERLRADGARVETDLMERSRKGQSKQAARLDAHVWVQVGATEAHFEDRRARTHETIPTAELAGRIGSALRS